MSTVRNYLIESLVKDPSQIPAYEACVAAILEDRAQVTKGYPLYFKGTEIMPDYAFAYYLKELDCAGFCYDKAQQFSEKMRKLITQDGEFYYHVLNPLEEWVEHNIRDPFFYSKKNQYGYKDWYLQEGAPHWPVPEVHFEFACYVALMHIKYGASYMSVTANEILGFVTALGSDLPAKLKKHGSGHMPKEITEYKSAALSCKANDAFATIKIAMKEEQEEHYAKALDFLIRVLESGFPRSYSIDFRSPDKNYLPIKKTPKKGVHQLFANAVKYPALHNKIEKYARLAIKEFEWYNNLEGQHCAMPGTFAVFALGLLGEAYHELTADYLKICDGEHQELQGQFVLAYIEKYGFTAKGLELYKLCEENIQHLPAKLVAKTTSAQP
ncbi:MAG: DUF6138 family protein [Defluviitaleaceae bacterium]|nr:DUF6138 family protein [Defluviitaleaceae bacterium]